MTREGLHKLNDISIWEMNGDWKQWAKPNLPQDLIGQWNQLTTLLAGATPIDKNNKDSYIWEPTRGEYTVRTGYQKLQESQNQ